MRRARPPACGRRGTRSPAPRAGSRTVIAASWPTWVAGLAAVCPATSDPAGGDQVRRLLTGPGQPSADKLGVQPHPPAHACCPLSGRSAAGLGRAGRRPGLGRDVQLAEHFPQPPVHLLEDRRVLGHRQPRQLVEPGQRLVHPGSRPVAGRRSGSPAQSCISHHAPCDGAAPVRAPLPRKRYRPGTTNGAPAPLAYPHGGPAARRWTMMLESEARMATAEECREALESLTARIAEMSPEDRAAQLADRTLSCKVSDLGITFRDPARAGRRRPGQGGRPRRTTPAQIRFTRQQRRRRGDRRRPGQFRPGVAHRPAKGRRQPVRPAAPPQADVVTAALPLGRCLRPPRWTDRHLDGTAGPSRPRALRWARAARGILGEVTALIPRPRADIAPGAVHVPGWLTTGEQRDLVAACREWARRRRACARPGCRPAG